MLEGTVRYRQGDEELTLNEGDSLHWHGYIPHRVENCSDRPARILCVTTGAMEHMLESECEDEVVGAFGQEI